MTHHTPLGSLLLLGGPLSQDQLCFSYCLPPPTPFQSTFSDAHPRSQSSQREGEDSVQRWTLLLPARQDRMLPRSLPPARLSV